MNLVSTSCGECPLRQGKYTCLGLDRSRDRHGVKWQIEGHMHHTRPDWCPLPITITGGNGIAKQEKPKKKPRGAPPVAARAEDLKDTPSPPPTPDKPARAGRFFGGKKK